MDYLLSGGIVYDISSGHLKHMDLLIRNGCTAPYGGGSPPPGVEFIDCTDCIIAPNLIDTHFHANLFGGPLGANADIICIPNGVTTAIDAGSCGVGNIRGLLRYNVPHYTTDIKSLVNIASTGQLFGTPYDREEMLVHRISAVKQITGTW